MNRDRLGRWPMGAARCVAMLAALASMLTFTGCGMGGSRAPVGSAGIADSAASAASAPAAAPKAGSSPGAT